MIVVGWFACLIVSLAPTSLPPRSSLAPPSLPPRSSLAPPALLPFAQNGRIIGQLLCHCVGVSEVTALSPSLGSRLLPVSCPLHQKRHTTLPDGLRYRRNVLNLASRDSMYDVLPQGDGATESRRLGYGAPQEPCSSSHSFFGSSTIRGTTIFEGIWKET